jgi:homoserine dehydrogenase
MARPGFQSAERAPGLPVCGYNQIVRAEQRGGVNVNIALIGFGSVGQGFATLLRDKSGELAEQYGFRPRLVAVITRSRGSLYHANGLDPDALLRAMNDGGLASYPDEDGLRRDLTSEEALAYPDINVMVEVSPTNLQTGQPALALCYAALDEGKHVVLANKGPVALDYAELMAYAGRVRRRVLFEGTVMGGTPAIRVALESLAGCKITRVRGIINGTTNYMLTQMEQGRAYGEVLAEAKRLGYAESDPSGDVDGWDAAGKLLILANALFGRMFTLAELNVSGISGLTPEAIKQAAAEGMRWKLIAEATPDGGSVALAKLPLSHPLAGVSGTTNAVTFSTDLLGDVTVVGPGAGGVETGFAILADLLALHRLEGGRA